MTQGEESYQEVYQRVLTSSQLQPLTKFKSSKSFNLIYPDALKYPDFFNNNLLAQGRVIKVVRGKSALIRAFCYQIMKLTFEIDIPDVDYVEIFKNVIFHPALLLEDTDMQSPSSGRSYTDRQYKRIIADFIEVMIHQSIPNFELALMEYPIVEEALVKSIENLISNCFPDEKHIPSDEMLQWLSKTFVVGLEKHGRCYKFQESDVFLYQENEDQFYISFLNDMAEVSDYSQSTYRFEGRLSRQQKVSSGKQFKNSSPQLNRASMDLDEYQLPIHPSDKYRYSAQIYNRRTQDSSNNYRKTIDNKSFIRDLAREVDESLHNDKPSEKHSKIGSLLDIMSDRSSKDLSQPYKASQESSSGLLSEEDRKPPSVKVLKISQDSEQMTPQFTTSAYFKDEDYYNPFTKKYSEQYMSQMYEKNHQFDYVSEKDPSKFIPFQHYNQANSFQLDNQFYNPCETEHPKRQKQSYLPYEMPKNTYSNQFHIPKFPTLIDSLDAYQPKQVQEQQLIYKPKTTKKFEKPEYKQPILSKGAQQSKGTLYRQFTDTKILQMVNTFQRIKINNIRQRYRGKHRKDLKNHY